MEQKDIACNTLISAQRALLGVITSNIRAVSIKWEGVEKLNLRIHYDSQPTEDEVEDMEIVTAEIIADVPFHCVDPIEIIVTNEPITALKFLDRLIYLRKEVENS